MLFSSCTFLFLFLPAVLILYYVVKEKYRNYILLLFSLIFYSWGEPKYIILMLLSIVFNYFFAILIEKYRKRDKLILVVSLFFDIGLLFVFKYLDFFIVNINNIFNSNISLFNKSLPIGISFYTFQILSYVVDVYRKKVKVQKNIFLLGTYISFFPQLIAGPIVRYEIIEKQLYKRNHSFDKFVNGIRRFVVGVAKKVIIANNIAVITDAIFNSEIVTQYSWYIILFGALCISLQVYYDFSGYSDMAIGLGKMFGFDFLENFNYPYISLSITEFWKRWHISLSSWFKDYLYIPLGGNRVGKLRWIINLFIIWILTGLWHGASWNYVIWGIYFALILLIEKKFLNNFFNKIPKIIRWIYAFYFIILGGLIFRIEDVSLLKDILINLFTFKNSCFKEFISLNYSLINRMPHFVVSLFFMFPIYKVIENKFNNNIFFGFLRDIVLIILLFISVCYLLVNAYNPFLYFRF